MTIESESKICKRKTEETRRAIMTVKSERKGYAMHKNRKIEL